MYLVLYHYSNGINYAGTHRKVFETRERARGWISWMRQNRPGFVLDELI